MAVREQINRKALIFIDEIYPSSNDINALYFPTDSFIDEAARWVVRAVPLRLLGGGVDIPREAFHPLNDGSGSIAIPSDFIRLICFRIEGWSRHVAVPILDTDIRYLQQADKVLRGGEVKPVVVLCENAKKLEYYSSSKGAYATIADARYFGFDSVDDNYPEKLIEITARKVAELVLATMNDIQGLEVNRGRIAEILQTL